MELSIFVAKVAAIAYFSAGVGVLGGQVKLTNLIDSFAKSSGLTMVTGMMSVIIGMLIVVNHNVWVQDWPVLVTIIGWAALIKGFLYLAFPTTLTSFKPMFRNEQGWGLFMIVLGAVFGYFGFIV